MPEDNASSAVLDRIKRQVSQDEIRVTQHAQQEMVEDGYSLDEVLEGIQNAIVLEEYPQHRRGACCLLGGRTTAGRPIHVVCSVGREVVILITVYEPKPPKWVTPTGRRKTP